MSLPVIACQYLNRSYYLLYIIYIIRSYYGIKIQFYSINVSIPAFINPSHITTKVN